MSTQFYPCVRSPRHLGEVTTASGCPYGGSRQTGNGASAPPPLGLQVHLTKPVSHSSCTSIRSVCFNLLGKVGWIVVYCIGTIVVLIYFTLHSFIKLLGHFVQIWYESGMYSGVKCIIQFFLSVLKLFFRQRKSNPVLDSTWISNDSFSLPRHVSCLYLYTSMKQNLALNLTCYCCKGWCRAQ